jgi:1,4-dihydroxy-2-naphthoate polyprenyltransferase
VKPYFPLDFFNSNAHFTVIQSPAEFKENPMKDRNPGFLRMIRAPFLSSILAPLIAGTLLSVLITGAFSLAGFLLVLMMGVGLHAATNVYNDIYDTLQGSDRINVNRNEFSGGSGILVDHPDYLPVMRRTARAGLMVAGLATVGLTFVVRRALWPQLWGLFAVSAFLSKYYTAAPVKLAYRGLGEFFVWLSFGPMAVWVAAVSQNLGWHPLIAAASPATGISTLSILLIGQMIDLPADKATGKWGIAARIGIPATCILFLAAQLMLVLDLFWLAWNLMPSGMTVLLGVVPYALLLPSIWVRLKRGRENVEELKSAAKMNVQLHLLFSLLFCAGLAIALFY